MQGILALVPHGPGIRQSDTRIVIGIALGAAVLIVLVLAAGVILLAAALARFSRPVGRRLARAIGTAPPTGPQRPTAGPAT